jgi:transcriptional regulator with XRE-family HTH domain
MTSTRPRLRALREERGWTQQEVAEQIARLAWLRRRERVGVNADMVAKWERGEKRPSPRYRELLCLLFGADAHTLGIGGPAQLVAGASAEADDGSLIATLGGAASLLDQLWCGRGDLAAKDVRRVEGRTHASPRHAQAHRPGYDRGLGPHTRNGICAVR